MIEKNLKNWLQENILNKDKSIHIDLEDIKFKSLTNNVEVCNIKDIEVDINNCGVISHIFKSIKLNIKILKHKNQYDICYITLSYLYGYHLKGSNVRDVRYASYDNCKSFEIQ